MKLLSGVWISLPIILLSVLGFLATLGSERGEFRAPALLSSLNGWVTDRKLELRGPRKLQEKIVIVGVDNESIDKLGRWPWHRDRLAQILEEIVRYNPKVVGVDFLAPQPDVRVPEALRKELQQRRLDGLADKHETDEQLIEFMRREKSRIVMGAASEFSCQPRVDGESRCPILSKTPGGEILKRFSMTGIDSRTPSELHETPLTVSRSVMVNFPKLQSEIANLGLYDLDPDVDGVMRKSTLFKYVNGVPIPSFAFEVTRVALGEKFKLDLNLNANSMAILSGGIWGGPALRVQNLEFEKSGKKIPVNPAGKLDVNFVGRSSIFPRISAAELVSGDSRVAVKVGSALSGLGNCKTCATETRFQGVPILVTTLEKSELFKDAVVLFGFTSPLFDVKPMPLDPHSPGVINHAMVIENLLADRAFHNETQNQGWILMLLLLTVGAFLFSTALQSLTAAPAVLLSVGSLVIFGFLDLKFLFKRDQNWHTGFIYFEYLSIAVMTLINKYGVEEKRRKFLAGAFSRYVSPQVVQTLIRDPKRLALGGAHREISVLFCDVRGFMTLTEQLRPEVLQTFLKDYHNVVTPIIIDRGTLDKFIGDSVMAFWGAPLDQPEHARSVCDAAVQIVRTLEEKNKMFQKNYGTTVRIGIGINSGTSIVGNMGSEKVFSYTAIGENVNLASRIERLTRHYGVNILATRATLDAIPKGQSAPPHRVLDVVQVKGSQVAVELIQIFERAYPQEALDSYQKGRNAYHAREWERAIAEFSEADRRIQSVLGEADEPCRVMLGRCRDFMKTPPREDWDGSWEMLGK